MISVNLYLNIDHLFKIYTIDTTYECVKIKVIKRIKQEFYKMNTSDFELDDKGYHVSVHYNGNKCEVNFEGKHRVQMKVVYDDVYLCIGSIEYDYQNWEE